jgi:broad specificity phosphatase PhoE
MPTATREVPPESWHLSAEGRAAADALSRTLPPHALLYASDEPKAWETLGGSSSVTRDRRFNEVIRVGEPWEGNFRELRRQYVEGVGHSGWEPYAMAAERFEAGVSAVLKEAAVSERPAVIATHGMVMTTWLVSRGAVLQSAAGDFWSDLRFPDCLIVDSHGLSVRRYP